MDMCSDCQSIETHKRSASGHLNLRHQGYDKAKSYKPLGQAGVAIEIFKCESCGTLWEYEDDKNDQHVGWRLRR